MELKVLYIGNFAKESNGASIINNRNFEILKRIFPIVDRFSLPLPSNKVLAVWQLLSLKAGGGGCGSTRALVDLLQKKYNYVFISSSIYGRLAKTIKKHSDACIICFYHNIEYYYASDLLKQNVVRYIPYFLSAWYNEFLATKWSDKLIVLNLRDKKLLKKKYNKDPDCILPTSMPDCFNCEHLVQRKVNTDSFYYLFVGYNFPPNAYGIDWFLKNVSKHIPGKLLVVGKNMDKLVYPRGQYNVEFLGFVDDLAPYYANAAFVIAPIFSGGGMKTKTAEALMYGKTIFGTKESFEGYNFSPKIGAICMDAREFIDNINNYLYREPSSFNYYSRELFEKEHSLNVSIKLLEKLCQL